MFKTVHRKSMSARIEESQKGNNTWQLFWETDAWGTSCLIHHRRALTTERGVGIKPQNSKKVNCLALCLKAKRKLV